MRPILTTKSFLIALIFTAIGGGRATSQGITQPISVIEQPSTNAASALTESTRATYQKITSTDELEDGATYLIIHEDKDDSKAMGNIDSDGFGEALNITLNTTNNTCYIDGFSGFIFEKQNDGNYKIKVGDNYLKGTTDNTTFSTTTSSSATVWEITFNSLGNASINNSSNTKRYIKGYTSGNKKIVSSFKHYTSGATTQLYKKASVAKIVNTSIGSTGYSTLYYSDMSFELPDGLEGYTITFNDDDNTLTATKQYDTDSPMPKGEGIILKGTPNTTYTLTEYNGDCVTKESTGNILAGTDSEQEVTASDDNCLYIFGVADETVGFYLASADGKTFTNGAHKAYISIPYDASSDSAKGLKIDFGEANAIRNICQEAENGHVYSITGIEVGQKGLKPGLYITNGRKFVVK